MPKYKVTYFIELQGSSNPISISKTLVANDSIDALKAVAASLCEEDPVQLERIQNMTGSLSEIKQRLEVGGFMSSIDVKRN